MKNLPYPFYERIKVQPTEMAIAISPTKEKVIDVIQTTDGRYLAYTLDKVKIPDLNRPPWITIEHELKIWKESWVTPEEKIEERYIIELETTFKGHLKTLFWIIGIIEIELWHLKHKIKKLLRRLRRNE